MQGCHIEFFTRAPQLVVFHFTRIIPADDCTFISLYSMSEELTNPSKLVSDLQGIPGIEAAMVLKHRLAITIGTAFMEECLRRRVLSDVLAVMTDHFECEDPYLSKDQQAVSWPQTFESQVPPGTYRPMLEMEEEGYGTKEEIEDEE